MKVKQFFVTCAVVYPDRSTKTMKRVIESTTPRKAVVEAVSKRKDHGYAFIVQNAPVLVFCHEGERTASWAFTVDLRLGEYVARVHRLNSPKTVLKLLKGAA